MILDQRLQAEKSFNAFLTKAVTRGGVPHTIDSIERDAQGNLIAVRGTVTPKAIPGESEASVDVIWNNQGLEANTGNSDYALVTRQSVEEWRDELNKSGKKKD